MCLVLEVPHLQHKLCINQVGKDILGKVYLLLPLTDKTTMQLLIISEKILRNLPVNVPNAFRLVLGYPEFGKL